MDDHGRILVPANLIKHAGLTKDVTIVGTADGRAEVWDTARWNACNEDINPEELKFELIKDPNKRVKLILDEDGSKSVIFRVFFTSSS